MRFRLTYLLFFSFLAVNIAAQGFVYAQPKDDAKSEPAPPPAPPPEAPPAPPPETPGAPPATPDDDTAIDAVIEKKDKNLSEDARWAEAVKTWKDIVVLPRKSFLKQYRVELSPFIGTTVNDQIIQHTAFGLDVNFFLTDILAIGLRGMLYLDSVLPDEFWVRNHFHRVPTINRYLYSAFFDFSYVPIYGKFTVFNQHIFQYEVYVMGGVGITQTEAIPRDFNFEPFQSTAMTILFPSVGGRLFFTKWLAAQITMSHYLMLDRFEKTGRTTQDGNEAIANGETERSVISSMIFSVGVSVFFPLDFNYTTFR